MGLLSELEDLFARKRVEQVTVTVTFTPETPEADIDHWLEDTSDHLHEQIAPQSLYHRSDPLTRTATLLVEVLVDRAPDARPYAGIGRALTARHTPCVEKIVTALAS